MPISDEIIELAPVNKTKKLLIIMFVAMGLLLALAVVFLVLYLIKPSVEESTARVNEVTITSSTLFKRSEDGIDVFYASVGTEYRIDADIAVENGASQSISWDVSPRDALRIEQEVTNDGAYILFVPKDGYNGTTVSIKARSASNVDKMAEVKFKVVFQGAESISLDHYYITTDSTRHFDIESDTIEVPYYTTATNNKQFAVMLTQNGKYDETTGTYSDLSYKSGEGIVDVKVKSGSSVTVGSKAATGFYFSASGVGDTVLTIVANEGYDAPNVERELKISVKSPVQYGCAENIYIFDKAIVDAAFIEKVLDGGRISLEKLDAEAKKLGATRNPASITLPQSLKYGDIQKHVLLDPISLQYDTEKKAMKDGWQSKIGITSSSSAVSVSGSQNLNSQLTANSLAGTEKDSNKCKLTITDTTKGSARVSKDVNVKVVARNSGGDHKVTVGTSEVSGNVAIAAGGTAQITVTYDLRMPRDADVAPKALELGYVTPTYILSFDPDKLEVTQGKSTTPLDADKVLTLDSGAMTISLSGSSTTSVTDYTGTVVFDVKVKSEENGDKPTLTFTKVGTSLSATPNWSADTELDKQWNFTVTFDVTKEATEAHFDEDTALALITAGGHGGKFEVTDKTHAIAYIQNKANGNLDIDFTKFVTSLGAIRTTLSVNGLDSTVLDRPNTSSTELSFKGKWPSNSSDTVATILIAVKSVNNKDLGTFYVGIKLIDAISSFQENTEVVEKTYSKTGYAGEGIALDYTYVRAVKHLETTPTLQESYASINLYRGDTVNAAAKLDPESKGADTVFTYTHTDEKKYEVFKLSSTRVLYPACDLYELSWNLKIDFSKILVEFVMADTVYVKPSAENATLRCQFNRAADDVALYKSSSLTVYDDATRISQDEENTDGANTYHFTHAVSIGDPVGLKVSPILKIRDYSDGNKEISVVHGTGTISVLGVTMDLSAIDATKTAVASANFKAPMEVEPGTQRPYYITINCGTMTKGLRLNVQNYARKIESIVLCDASGNEISSEKVFDFGKFIGGSGVTSYTVKVRVTYEGKADDQKYFETAVLKLPDIFTVSGEHVTHDSANAEYNLIRLSSDLDSENNEYDFTCVIALAKQTDPCTGTISITRSIEASALAAVERDFTVDVGLHSVVVTDSVDEEKTATVVAGGANTLEYSLVLSDNADSKSVKLNIDYKSLNEFIAYGTDKNFTAEIKNEDGTSSTVNGLSFTNNANSEEPSVIVSTAGKVGTHKFNLVVTDTTGGVTSGNKFTLAVTVNVRMDIFDLNFSEVGAYQVATTGEESGAQSVVIAMTYNNDDPNYAPHADYIKNVKLSAVQKPASGAEKVLGEKDGLYVNDGILYVSNKIISGTDYYVRAIYTKLNGETVTVDDKHIEIVTKAHTLSLDQSAGNLAVTGGQATLITKTGEAKLAALVKNNGTTLPVIGKTVTYKLYSDPDRKTEYKSTDISIDEGGNILIKKPSDVTGYIYYRASYTDDIDGAVAQNIDVVITYYIVPDTVAIDESKVNSSIYAAATKTLTLYIGNSGKTLIDLESLISVKNSKFTSLDYTGVSGLTKSISLNNASSDPAVNVSGTQLTPLKAGNNKFGVTVGYKGESTDSAEYSVTVVQVPALLTLDSKSGKIDILSADNSKVVTIAQSTFGGLTPTYVLSTSDAGLTVTGTANEKTVTVSDKTAVTMGSHVLTATVTYANAVTGGYLTLDGTLTSTENYTLTVGCDYTPSFELQQGGTSIAENTAHVIVSDGTYTVKVTNINANVTYKATASPEVVTVGDFTGGVANVEVGDTASGTFTVKVTPVVYGKELTANATTGTYIFTYGQNPTTKIYVSTNGGAYAELNTANNTNIDFTDDSKKTKVKYEISGVDMSLDVSKVHLQVIGVAASKVGAVQKDNANNKFYAEIIVDTDTTLTVGGYIEIGTRTVYLSNYTAKFVSTKPIFAFADTVVDELLPGASATLAVTKIASGADFSVKYELVSGGEFVTLNTNTLTAKNQLNSSDKLVVVRATVTVTNGVYADQEYTLDKTFTVYSVQRPTIAWNTTKMTVDADSSAVVYGTVDYALNTAIAYSAGTHTFAVGTSTFSVVSEGTTVASGHYNLSSDGQLTVYNTLESGGKIAVKVTAKITSDIYKDVEISDTVVITVRPKVTVNALTISNGAGIYDISGMFKPNGVEEGDYTVTKVVVNSAVDGVSASGTNVVFSKNITDTSKISVTATVAITSGTFAGLTLTASGDVTVGSIVINGVEVEYVGGAYKAVTNIYTGDKTVTNYSISVKDTADADAVIIAGNNTDNVSIQVVQTANVNGQGNRTIPLVCLATTNDGYVYYSEFELYVNSVVANVIAKNGSSDVPETIEMESNGSYTIDLAEDNSLPITVDGVSAKIGEDTTQSVTATYSGRSVILTAADVSSTVDNITLTITVNVDGTDVTVNKTYSVKVTAPEQAGSYNISAQNTVLSIADSNNAVTSSWTPQTYTNYNYGYYIYVKAPGSYPLSNYITSIELLQNNGAETYITSSNSFGTNNAVTLYCDGLSSTAWGHTHSSQYSNGIKIRFTYNTASAISGDITVTYRAYNNRNNGYYQDVSTTYRMRVIDKVTIHLDYNGGVPGTNPTQVQEQYKGEFTQLPEPTRVGYTFDGWYTSATLDGIKYENNNSSVTVTFTDTTTLYAHWTRATCEVTFNANGGTLDTYSSKKTVDCSGTLGSLPTPTRTGYRFVGWHIGSESGTVVDSSYNVGANTTLRLFAEWSVITYTVTLNNNGNASTTTANVVDGYVLSDPAARDGYTFNGWYTKADGNGIKIASGAEYKDLAPIYNTLYAYWTKNVVKYIVTLDAGEGFIGSSHVYWVEVEENATFDLHTIVVPTRDGYVFGGWSKTEGFDVTEKTTITASWKAIYTVNFYVTYDDGTDDELVKTVTYIEGDKFGALPTVERDGYNMSDDWTIGKAYDATAITAETEVDSTCGNIYIKASKKATYTVNFYITYDDGTDDELVKTAYYTEGDKFGTLPTVERDGYNMSDDWTIGNSEGATAIAADDEVPSSCDIYITATKNAEETPEP